MADTETPIEQVSEIWLLARLPELMAKFQRDMRLLFPDLKVPNAA